MGQSLMKNDNPISQKIKENTTPHRKKKERKCHCKNWNVGKYTYSACQPPLFSIVYFYLVLYTYCTKGVKFVLLHK